MFEGTTKILEVCMRLMLFGGSREDPLIEDCVATIRVTQLLNNIDDLLVQTVPGVSFVLDPAPEDTAQLLLHASHILLGLEPSRCTSYHSCWLAHWHDASASNGPGANGQYSLPTQSHLFQSDYVGIPGPPWNIALNGDIMMIHSEAFLSCSL